MPNIGRKIAYDKTTGNVIVDTGEKSGYVSEITNDDMISMYSVLSEMNRETFEIIELPYGLYAQDFFESAGYRVNPNTQTLEFLEKPPEEGQEPVYIAPLSVQLTEANAKISRLESQNDLLNADLIGLTEALAEMGVL